MKILGLGENFRFRQNFWGLVKILVWAKILGNGESIVLSKCNFQIYLLGGEIFPGDTAVNVSASKYNINIAELFRTLVFIYRL